MNECTSPGKAEFENFMAKNVLSHKDYLKKIVFLNIYEIFKRELKINSIRTNSKILAGAGSLFTSLQVTSFL